MSYRQGTSIKHRASTILLSTGMVVIAVFAVLAGCRQAVSRDVHTAGDSFFPLAEGNRWIFTASGIDGRVLRDTVLIDAKERAGDIDFFRVRASWPGFEDGLWVRRDSEGNLLWATRPGGVGGMLLRFDAMIGNRWGTAGLLHECIDSIAMFDNYAAVRTPYGLFDGARLFGCLPSCSDFGWGVSAARGIGPVVWYSVTIAGPHEWRLVTADIHDDCDAQPPAARVVNGQ
jgi:hypothetical protein